MKYLKILFVIFTLILSQKSFTQNIFSKTNLEEHLLFNLFIELDGTYQRNQISDRIFLSHKKMDEKTVVFIITSKLVFTSTNYYLEDEQPKLLSKDLFENEELDLLNKMKPIVIYNDGNSTIYRTAIVESKLKKEYFIVVNTNLILISEQKNEIISVIISNENKLDYIQTIFKKYNNLK